MFNGFPGFNGNYFTYQQYFALVLCASSFYTLILLLIFRAISSFTKRDDTNKTTIFTRKNVSLPFHVAAPYVAITFLLFFGCFMMWLVLTLLAFGHTAWTGRLIMVFSWYAILTGLMVWAQKRTPAPQTVSPNTKSFSLLDLLQQSMLYFDDVCIPILISCMVIATSVPVTSLGIAGFSFGFGCACIALTPIFYTSCLPQVGCCWRWCFCCKNCSMCRDKYPAKIRRHLSFTVSSSEIDSSCTKLNFNKKDDDVNEDTIDSELDHQRKRSLNNYDEKNCDNLHSLLEVPPTSTPISSFSCSSPSNSFTIGQHMSRIPKSVIVGQVVAILLALAIVATTSGTCIGFFAPDMKGLHLGPITWSSSFTRRFLRETSSNQCDWNNARFCHLYLTVPSTNASKSLIVTAHTKIFENKHSVKFGSCIWESSNSSCITVPQIYQSSSSLVDWMPEFKRQVHSAYMQDLENDSVYALWIVDDSENTNVGSTNPDLTFRTLPDMHSGGDKNIMRFIVGGDMGLTPEATAVSIQASNQNPSFAVIGGDIAYANDIPACISLWDSWISTYEKVMITKDGNHSIPIITVVGNHDVGSNAGSGSNALRYSKHGSSESRTWNTKEIPFIFAFFPHDVVNDDSLVIDSNIVTPKVVVPMKLRRPFHLHSFDHSLEIFNLDSGHVVKYEDSEQLSIFSKSLKDQRRCKIAVYHVPIFPSGDYNWNAQVSFMTDPRKYWLPEFERIGIHAAFEHHVHTMKETVSLNSNSTAAISGGTTYFGDGRWGITGSDDMTKIKSEVGKDGDCVCPVT